MRKSIALSVALSLSAFAAGANAQEMTTASLEESLVLEEGYTEISEGFYAKVTELGESYVAKGEQGVATLRQVLIDLRDEANARHAKANGKPSPAPASYDRMIEDLGVSEASDSGKANIFQRGDCSGPNTHHQTMLVRAGTWQGSAAGGAVTNSDPTINTSNYSHVFTENVRGEIADQVVNTYGTTPVQTFVQNTQGVPCQAVAYSSITCPGRSTPSLAALDRTLARPGCL